MAQETGHYLFYAGISTFGGYKHTTDLDNIDIAVMGVPFDGGTTNRSGARMGPNAIRKMSPLVFGFNYMWDGELDLDQVCPNIIDYGDVGQGYGSTAVETMLTETFKHADRILSSGAKLLTIGGDHTIPYGPIRAAYKKHGKLALLHFDSHQDTIPSNGTISHANFAYDLVEEGCIDPTHSVQACIRTPLDNPGYNIFYARDVMNLSPEELAKKIKAAIGDMPVYLTFDVDSLDPAYAPGTGTPVVGGPSTHYLRTVLRNLTGLNIVAADIVEVAPQYDHGEITALAAASVAQDIMCLMAYNK